MNLDSKILVLGHRGLVGSAIVRNLLSKGYMNLVMIPKKECDLRNMEAVNNLFNTAAAPSVGVYPSSKFKLDFAEKKRKKKLKRKVNGRTV